MNTTMPITLASIGEIPWPYFIAPIAAIAALIMARVFAAGVMKRPEGDDEMIRIAQAVREGAMAYLTRQYRVVAMVFVVLVLFLGALVALKLQPWQTLIGVPVAGLLSGLCGWFGMRMATNASARTTAAVKISLNDGLTVAFRSGAVMGLTVVGFALLDVSVWFGIFNAMDVHISQLTTVMLSFGMGASTQALFARVGGGIYTKAADVGADLVGKVEAGIPEDDARNPATIADNVGDNVGDVAGMGADLYESYYGSILATMALGAAAAFTIGKTGTESTTIALGLAAAPIALAGIGIICSILGVFTVKAKDDAGFNELLKSLHKGVYVASGFIVLGAFGLLYMLFGNSPEGTLPFAWWGLGLSIVSGLAAGLVIAHATEYYTSYEHPPTRRIAEQALTGPATVIIAGIAEGMKSTWASLLTVVIAILAAFAFAGGGENFLMGLYGVGIAAVGMLSTLGITLATDAYGPIADNAGGNAEMTDQPAFVRERTDMLDSLGNTTAATGKGFAIGSAALTALALFAAYIQVVQLQITSQAETYAAKHAGVEGAPYVMYQGYRKFAIVDPTQLDEDGNPTLYVDGGMLIDRFQFEALDVSFKEAVSKGDVITTIEPLASRGGETGIDFKHARSFLVTKYTDPEMTEVEYQFEIISTRNGRLQDILAFYDVTIANPRLLGGIFIGVLLAFLFCAMTMAAVGRAAYEMMGECRRQFGKMREAFRADGMSEEQIADPMQWPKQIEFEGVTYPDYTECVSISTASAQREMVVPAVLAISIPIAVGLVLSVPGVLGMLAGGLTSGFAVAVFMANAGGAWDNAKKLLESLGTITANDAINNEEQRNKIPEAIRKAILSKAEEMIRTGKGDEAVYGKGSDDHKATVVGDTVGDPFKDTSGPSLNILIKLISIVSVVFAGLIVAYGPIISSLLGLN